MVNKMVKEYRKDTSFYILIDPIRLYLWILTQTCISHHDWKEKKIKFMVFRLLKNAIVSQKIESVHFFHGLPR